jgi:L-rhamnose 1-dehydrogenase
MLKGKTALVTGASNGIGKAIALMAAREGANVAINYCKDDLGARDTQRNAEAYGVMARLFQGDVGKSGDVRRIVEDTVSTFGRIDILVNNAGIFLDRDFFEITEEVFDRTISVNLKGCFLMMQMVARHMVQQEIHGRIVNISSALAATGCELQPHYAASKAGVNMLTQAGATCLAPYGITVNAIMPGTIETNANKNQLSDPAVAAQILSRTPLKSYGSTDYIAAAVKYFLMPDAEWTTGSILRVDGGYLA